MIIIQKKLIKVGDSLALVIPSIFVKNLGLTKESILSVSGDNDKITIEQAASRQPVKLGKLPGPAPVPEDIASLLQAGPIDTMSIENDDRLAAILAL